MNVEKLHKILIDLNQDIKENRIIDLLSQVQSQLQKQVSQPNQATHQTNFVLSLEKLYEALGESKYNEYSPGWKGIISEISGDDMFGVELKHKIEQMIASNPITPARALEDIKKIATEFQSFQNAIENTLGGFTVLRIKKDELKPGECELGYIIPRKYIENKLSELKNEIHELDFILNHISEAVTGEKQEHKVKTISSSEFLLYVIIGLQVANVFSKAIERILNIYKDILEIRVYRNKLKDKGVPKTKTKNIETHVNGMMESEIKKIAKEVIKEHYKGDNHRKNELENGIVISLNKLANRIDKGFNVEIRVEPLPEPEENNKSTAEQKKKSELIQSIKSSSQKIEFIETKGESILRLPEKKN